jgi:putative FmdB family regulatory protein
MPTYEYACKQCGKRFEIFQPFSAKALRTHDECGGELQKVFHPAGVVFKGSGFYSTDSRPKAKSKTSSKASSETSKNTGEPKKESSSDKTRADDE